VERGGEVAGVGLAGGEEVAGGELAQVERASC